MDDKQLTAHYEKIGNDRFYRFLLADAIGKIVRMQSGEKLSPETELLKHAEHFVSLYRKTNLQVYLDVSRCLRKAGHKIYRLMLKKELIQRNARFLQVV
jgi:hypothetical protein